MNDNDIVCGYCGKKNMFGTHICTDEQEQMQREVYTEEAEWANIQAAEWIKEKNMKVYKKLIRYIKKLFGGTDD